MDHSAPDPHPEGVATVSSGRLPWLECSECGIAFRFDESPALALCAECASWLDWIAGEVVCE